MWAVPWPIHVLSMSGFVQEVPNLGGFNLGCAFFRKLSAPPSGETASDPKKLEGAKMLCTSAVTVARVAGLGLRGRV